MLRRIGDVVLTTPAVRALKKLHPEAEVDFLAEPPSDELLRGHPGIRRVLSYSKGPLAYAAWLWRVRAAGYDWVIDYMGNPRTAMLTALSGAAVKAGPGHVSHRWAYTHYLRESDTPYYSAREKIRVLRSLGLSPDETDCLPELPSDAASEESADLLLRRMRLPPGPLVGFAPASRRRTRRWPAEKYASLGRRLRDELGARVLIFHGPGEESAAREIRDAIGEGAYISPRTPNLKVLASLIGRCSVFVSNCSGPKHLAVARGVATVTIHASSDPVCWNPPDLQRHPFVRREELECIGCMKNSCPYELQCLRELPPDPVFEHVRRLLKIPAGTGESA